MGVRWCVGVGLWRANVGVRWWRVSMGVRWCLGMGLWRVSVGVEEGVCH